MRYDQSTGKRACSDNIENARLRRELAMALERQAATAEILNVIAKSPTDVQLVFDVISGSAQRLLGGQSALVTRVVGNMLHLAACTAESPDGDEEIRVSFPAALTDVVFDHEGTVTKVIGDAIQVLFNAPGEQPDYAMRAVACAQELDRWAEMFRERWKQKGVDFGATRIGVHAGPALVGNFGGDRYFDYTAYGDTINIAARLEVANKALGTRLCVSDVVASAVRAFRGRPVGDLVLRGRREALRVHELLSPDRFDDLAKAKYAAAFRQLEAADVAALPAFAALVGAHADDPLANFHLRRLLNGACGTTIRLG